MSFNCTTGWFLNLIHCPSPNFNERPDNAIVSLLVIHNISLPPGQFGTKKIHDFFQNKLCTTEHSYFREIASIQVSAHFLIERTGSIVQFVSCFKRAWHAGISVFQGDDNCNDFSIGIELEGTDEQPYTEEQYEALTWLTKELRLHFPLITHQRICGHSDIAPLRKTDPGPYFDWSRFLENI
ncbi:UNVERIFIED_CONTAM: hypothetical protein GTU68_052151 [Idotea baltica]|nr:hypothetical protein [Idotea baltica]